MSITRRDVLANGVAVAALVDGARTEATNWAASLSELDPTDDE